MSRRYWSSEGMYKVEDRGFLSPCWIWQRGKNNGYGELKINGESNYAHRYFYEKHKGPIPSGLEVDHLCRQRACVNPEHLEAVTKIINGRRGNSTLLTQEEVDSIREMRVKGSKIADIAEHFGISKSVISSIINGHSWK